MKTSPHQMTFTQALRVALCVKYSMHAKCPSIVKAHLFEEYCVTMKIKLTMNAVTPIYLKIIKHRQGSQTQKAMCLHLYTSI